MLEFLRDIWLANRNKTRHQHQSALGICYSTSVPGHPRYPVFRLLVQPMGGMAGEFNFTISYMAEAYSYADTEVEFSFDKENWYKLPFTECKMQSIRTFSGVPFMKHPDKTGVINSAISNTWAIPQ